MGLGLGEVRFACGRTLTVRPIVCIWFVMVLALWGPLFDVGNAFLVQGHHKHIVIISVFMSTLTVFLYI